MRLVWVQWVKLEIADLPLSVNVYQTFVGDNYVEFLWDPSPTKTKANRSTNRKS